MFRKPLKFIAALALAVALSAPTARAETYKIGAIMAMTGAASFYGTIMTRGAQLAIDEINAAGGINGNMLELVIEDHKGGKPQPAVSGMNRMISLQKVQAVLSSFSPPTLAIAPIADEKGILVLNGGGVSNKLIGASKYLFHNRSLAIDLARGIAIRAHQRGFERMAQIGIKDEFGDSVISEANKVWKKLGHTVVATEQYAQGATNVDTQIAKLRAAKPDFVANWGLANEAGRIVKRMRDFGMTKSRMRLTI
ncbi:MAG: ABC transporter substrate-binding protein, partial [Alphaproteobacteria bacterium]